MLPKSNNHTIFRGQMLPNFFRYLYVKLRSAQNSRLNLSATQGDRTSRKASRGPGNHTGFVNYPGFRPVDGVGRFPVHLNQ